MFAAVIIAVQVMLIGLLIAVLVIQALRNRPSVILSERDRDRDHGRGNPFVFEGHADGA